jgi:hypothetical protein
VGVLPSIIPVNYLLDDDKVVIRTDAGSKLAAALRGAPVALEVDGADENHQVGWSVVVRGRVEEVTDEDKLAELRKTPLLAWHPPSQTPLYTNQPESGQRQTHKYRRPPLELVGIARPAPVHPVWGVDPGAVAATLPSHSRGGGPVLPGALGVAVVVLPSAGPGSGREC